MFSDLEKDYFSAEDFTFSIELVNGPTSIDISSYLIAVGEIQESLYGFADTGSTNFEFPVITFTVDNQNSEFSPSHANSFFDGVDFRDWQIVISLYDNIGQMYLMPPTKFDVADIEFNYNEAVLTAVHPLQKYWSRIWNMDKDSQYVNWSGLNHYGPWWSE